MTNNKYSPVQTTPFTIKEKLLIRIWHLVWALLYRPTPWFLKSYRIWLLRVFGATIDKTANPHNKAKIENPWNLTMGPFSSVGEDSWIYCLDKIVLEEYVCIGQNVQLLTGSHQVHSPNFEMITSPIHIKKGAWVAVSAIILPGVTIGSYSVIGAGSIVSKDMPEMMVCAGNPCKPIKKRELNLEDMQ